MLQRLSRIFNYLRLGVCGSVGKEAKTLGCSVVASLVFDIIVAEWGQWQQQISKISSRTFLCCTGNLCNYLLPCNKILST